MKDLYYRLRNLKYRKYVFMKELYTLAIYVWRVHFAS
jgi:hypothetical protein